MSRDDIGIMAGLVIAVGATSLYLKNAQSKDNSAYDELSKWYQDAIKKINAQAHKIADLQNQDKGNGVIVTVSDGIKNMESDLVKRIHRSKKASENIKKLVDEAGGIVKSGTDAGAKLIQESKKIVAWNIGITPKGDH